MRAWLRSYATKHPCHGFRRAWAALRYDECREVNKKKVHRRWREEELQVKVHSPRKRAGVSSIAPIEADAPKVVTSLHAGSGCSLIKRSGPVSCLPRRSANWSRNWVGCQPCSVRRPGGASRDVREPWAPP
ncbi:transposase [Mycobacterium sp. 852002-50816_SCH5313054-b]|uniref:transposase n=1 Tax=Mycobacterium sp. 852002-50816_SCH5313054-b TaxID=1834092 RepID=UPI003515D77A